MKSCLNIGGPPSKPKYSLATDSERYRDWERRKEPREGSEIDPETACIQKAGDIRMGKPTRKGIVN